MERESLISKMKIWRQIGSFAAMLLMLSSSGVHVLAQETSGTSSSLHSQDEKALRAQADDYARAFASGNSAALANMWTADGTYSRADGEELKGRAAIERFFASGFKNSGAYQLSITVDSLRFPKNDVAIEEGTCRPAQGPGAGNISHYQVVHVKENGKWLMAAVTETVREQASGDRLEDFAWLLGNWSARTAKGQLHLSVDWVGDNKFMRCAFRKEGASDSRPDEVEIIGWNPLWKRIVSWHFDRRGGFGSGRWQRDGQSWIENASNIESDGTASSGVNILHKLSDNSFTWRSTARSIAGTSVPDTDEITVTRDQ